MRWLLACSAVMISHSVPPHPPSDALQPPFARAACASHCGQLGWSSRDGRHYASRPPYGPQALPAVVVLLVCCCPGCSSSFVVRQFYRFLLCWIRATVSHPRLVCVIWAAMSCPHLVWATIDHLFCLVWFVQEERRGRKKTRQEHNRPRGHAPGRTKTN